MTSVKTALTLLLILSQLSCRDSLEDEGSRELYCGVSDPVSELEWLRTEVEGFKQGSTYMDAFVVTAIHKGERVFYINICCPACNIAPPEVRKCDGASLGRLGDGVDPDDLEGDAIIWRTLNGVCAPD